MDLACTLGSLFRVRFLRGNKTIEKSYCSVGNYFVTAESPSLFWLTAFSEASDSANVLLIMWLKALLIFLLFLWHHLLSLPLGFFFAIQVFKYWSFLLFKKIKPGTFSPLILFNLPILVTIDEDYKIYISSSLFCPKLYIPLHIYVPTGYFICILKLNLFKI